MVLCYHARTAAPYIPNTDAPCTRARRRTVCVDGVAKTYLAAPSLVRFLTFTLLPHHTRIYRHTFSTTTHYHHRALPQPRVCFLFTYACTHLLIPQRARCGCLHSRSAPRVFCAHSASFCRARTAPPASFPTRALGIRSSPLQFIPLCAARRILTWTGGDSLLLLACVHATADDVCTGSRTLRGARVAAIVFAWLLLVCE